MKETDDMSRFTIHDVDQEESIPDSIYVADAEHLRIEKLSTRVTLVSVLIPCLLVIVLGIAYLDIKNRVFSTQSTGSMGVQNLSRDLESRFSSLSLKQAKLEKQLAENTKGVETATAALQVNLKKSITELKSITDAKADRSALTAASKKSGTAVANLQNEMAALNEAFEKFDEELAGQILRMAEGLKKDQDRLTAFENVVQRLDSEKLSKESMNLALGLERLGWKELIKEKNREVEKKLVAMGKRIDALSQRLDAQANQKVSAPPAAISMPKPQSQTPPSTATPAGSSTIVEQTIN